MTTISSRSLVSLAVGAALALAACGGSESSGSSAGDPCDAATGIQEGFEAVDNSQSAEDAQAALVSVADALDDLSNIAGGDIGDDASRLAGGFRTLSEVDGEPTDEQLAVMEDDDLDAAGERLEDYLRETCDVEI